MAVEKSIIHPTLLSRGVEKKITSSKIPEGKVEEPESFESFRETEEIQKTQAEYRKQILKDDEEKEELRHKFVDLISGKEKKIEQATELLVDYIENVFQIYTTKDDLKSEMWIYQQGIYVPQGRTEVKILLRSVLKEWYSQYIYGLVLAKIEADTFIESNKFFSNKYPEEIAVQNGILNIYTRELSSFSSDKIFFNKLPVTYNPEAKCLKIQEFVKSVLSKEEDTNIFYEWMGFNLTNEYTYEKAVICVGNGRNGKDKLLELIKRLLGVENCCSIPLAMLHPDNFGISELFGKKANLAGEISGQELKDLTLFKGLTGRSLISAKRKFLREITFVNSAKFTFACNELPMVSDLTLGFWDRWILLEFPYTFVTKEDLDRAEDKALLKLRDENIIEKITTPEEMSGLLNMALEGLDRLRKNKTFSVTIGSEEVKKRWIQKSNSCVAFCWEKIIENHEGKITKKEFRQNYSKFCKENKVVAKSDMVIKKVLQEIYGANESNMNNGVTFDRVWEGITWKK